MLETILYDGYHLDKQKYKGNTTKSNRGDKYGLPHLCRWEKDKDLDNQFITIGEPCIVITQIEQIEYDYGRDRGVRPIFRTFRFHNEQCLVNWLEEFEIDRAL